MPQTHTRVSSLYYTTLHHATLHSLDRSLNILTPLFREHCAVKIIDTRKFALTPGLSPKELREEVNILLLYTTPTAP